MQNNDSFMKSSPGPNLCLTQEEIAEVQKVLQKHVPDRKVLVFGSRAKGTCKPFSDLDFCLLGDAPMAIEDLAELKEAFSDSDLPFRVDVVDWASLHPSFQSIVEKDGVLLPPI